MIWIYIVVGLVVFGLITAWQNSIKEKESAMAEKKGIYPTICMGAKGDLVTQMQELLVKWGSSVTPNGHFNIGTRTALLKFQNEKGLEIDGVCGPETWAELLKYAHIKFVEPGKKEPKPAPKELSLEEKVNILWEEHLKKEGK